LGGVGYGGCAEDGPEGYVRLDQGRDAWASKGVGDFEGNGLDDILLRNMDTGNVVFWAMEGDGAHSEQSFGMSAMNWMIEGVGDYDGNGVDDILWQQADTREVGYWAVQSDGSQDFVSLGTNGPNWDIAHLMAADEFVF